MQILCYRTAIIVGPGQITGDVERQEMRQSVLLLAGRAAQTVLLITVTVRLNLQQPIISLFVLIQPTTFIATQDSQIQSQQV